MTTNQESIETKTAFEIALAKTDAALAELNASVDRLSAAVADYEEFRKSSSATRNAIAGLKLPSLTK